MYFNTWDYSELRQIINGFNIYFLRNKLNLNHPAVRSEKKLEFYQKKTYETLLVA